MDQAGETDDKRAIGSNQPLNQPRYAATSSVTAGSTGRKQLESEYSLNDSPRAFPSIEEEKRNARALVCRPCLLSGRFPRHFGADAAIGEDLQQHRMRQAAVYDVGVLNPGV